MEPDQGQPRPGRKRRQALILVACAAALAIGALAARRLWWPGPAADDLAQLRLLHDAWVEFGAKRYDRATELLDRRAARVAPTPLDWMLRAQIAESQGKRAAALDCLKQIPDSDAVAPQAWLKAGQIELARRHARAAEKAYVRSLELKKDQVQPHRELAYLYAIQLRRAECDAQFRALAELVPLDYVLAFAWCQSFCKIWDPNEARPVLGGFVDEDPSDRHSRLALANSYRLTNQYDEADRLLRALPDSDPDARALRAQVAMDAGKVDVAEELVRGGPDDHARLNALRGQFALHHNDPRKAAAFFRASLRRDPDDRDAIQGLGTALRRLGDPEAKTYLDLAARHAELKRAIQDSVTTIKSDPKLFFKLGSICESLGRLPEARAWYLLAIKKDPLDAQAQQALNRLEREALEKSLKSPPHGDDRRAGDGEAPPSGGGPPGPPHAKPR